MQMVSTSQWIQTMGTWSIHSPFVKAGKFVEWHVMVSLKSFKQKYFPCRMNVAEVCLQLYTVVLVSCCFVMIACIVKLATQNLFPYLR